PEGRGHFVRALGANRLEVLHPADAEHAYRVAECVVPDEVPVPALKQQAVRLHVPLRLLTAVHPAVAELHVPPCQQRIGEPAQPYRQLRRAGAVDVQRRRLGERIRAQVERELAERGSRLAGQREGGQLGDATKRVQRQPRLVLVELERIGYVRRRIVRSLPHQLQVRQIEITSPDLVALQLLPAVVHGEHYRLE